MKPALLITDMLKDFVDEDGSLYIPKARRIVPVIRKVKDTLKERGVPVLYLNDAHAADDPEFADWPPHAVRGSKGAEVIPELAPEEGDMVIEKVRIKSFDQPEVPAKLDELGADYLIVTGVATDYCVRETALEARQRGLAVTIIEDAVAGIERAPGDIERVKEELRLAGAQFLSSQELLGDLEGRVHAA